MASELSFVEYIVSQLDGCGLTIAYKKMFGEYAVFANGKMCLLVCDNTCFVKINEATQACFAADAPTALPYATAKPHFVVENLDDRDWLCKLVRVTEKVTLPPKKRKK